MENNNAALMIRTIITWLCKDVQNWAAWSKNQSEKKPKQLGLAMATAFFYEDELVLEVRFRKLGLQAHKRAN